MSDPVDRLVLCFAVEASLEEASDPIVYTDAGDRIVYANRKARELTGFSGPDDLLDAERQAVESTSDPDSPQIYMFHHNTRSLLGIRFLKIVGNDPEIIGWLWLFRVLGETPRDGLHDSTFYQTLFNKAIEINRDLIQVNDKLKKTQIRMVHQEKLASIGQLAAGVAHELNNPVGFVSSNFASLRNYARILNDYIELLRQASTAASPELKKTIAEFEKARQLDFILDDLDELFIDTQSGVERITRIVQSLRKFSRVDFDNEPQPFDLNEGIRNTLVVANNELKYIAEVETDFGDIPAIECLGGEINQVLLNLIINACQAIQEQNRPTKGSIRIRTYRRNDMVYCEVADDGPGIPKSLQNRVYDPFFTTKDTGKGTGLGLNISYDIVVNRHGGEMQLDSAPGQGTRFTFGLPIQFQEFGEKYER